MRIRLLSVVLMFCLTGIPSLMLHAQDPPARAPDPFAAEQKQPDPDPADQAEQNARRMLQRARTLVRPQQKQVALRVIEMYPDTQTARRTQRLLDELARYEQAEQNHQAAEERWVREVREFWHARRLDLPPPGPPLVTITNESEFAVSYTLKADGMRWTTPLLMESGGRHELNHPALLQRRPHEGTVTYRLEPGRDYVFGPAGEDGGPRLFVRSRSE